MSMGRLQRVPICVRNIKSINIIVVYILPSCQLPWKNDDRGKPKRPDSILCVFNASTLPVKNISTSHH